MLKGNINVALLKCEMQLSTINFDQNANFANMHTVLFREKSVKLLYPLLK